MNIDINQPSDKLCIVLGGPLHARVAVIPGLAHDQGAVLELPIPAEENEDDIKLFAYKSGRMATMAGHAIPILYASDLSPNEVEELWRALLDDIAHKVSDNFSLDEFLQKVLSAIIEHESTPQTAEEKLNGLAQNQNIACN